MGRRTVTRLVPTSAGCGDFGMSLIEVVSDDLLTGDHYAKLILDERDEPT